MQYLEKTEKKVILSLNDILELCKKKVSEQLDISMNDITEDMITISPEIPLTQTIIITYTQERSGSNE